MSTSRPLPNPQVIKNFLNLYKIARDSDRKSFLSGTVAHYAGYAYKKGPVDTQLDEIVNNMQIEAETSQNFDDWFRFIFKLREKAEEAQSLKTKEDTSLLFQSLHGIASYIILYLTENQQDLFLAEIKKLTDDYNKSMLKKNGINTDKNNNGKEVPQLREEINKNILDLAYLADNTYIDMAIQNNLLNKKYYLLPQLKDLSKHDNNKGNYCSKEAKLSLPLYLQRGYIQWLYTYQYQHIFAISLTDFINPEKEKDIQKQIENKLIDQSPTSVIISSITSMFGGSGNNKLPSTQTKPTETTQIYNESEEGKLETVTTPTATPPVYKKK